MIARSPQYARTEFILSGIRGYQWDRLQDAFGELGQLHYLVPLRVHLIDIYTFLISPPSFLRMISSSVVFSDLGITYLCHAFIVHSQLHRCLSKPTPNRE